MRGEDVGRGFDGLDSTNGVTSAELGADGGEFDEDYFAEGSGGVGGYADCACSREDEF